MAHFKSSMHVLILLVVIACGAILPRAYADSTSLIAQIAPSTLTGSADYATDVRGVPWDFSSTDSYSSRMTTSSFVGGGSLQQGWFVGETAQSDSKIWLQNFGDGGSPIDTTRYRYLTFRMCASTDTGAIVYWHKDGSFLSDTFGGTVFKQVKSGCNIYTYDLMTERLPQAGSLAWNAGPIQNIAIRPATAAGVTIQVDYVRLSPIQPTLASAITVDWTTPVSHMSLSFDTAPNGTHPTTIASDVSGTTYIWNTPDLAPDTYYLIAQGNGTPQVSSPIVVHAPAAPEVHVGAVSPSLMSSTGDYATDVRGQGWNFDTSDQYAPELTRSSFVGGGSLSNGWFVGKTLHSDPKIWVQDLGIPRTVPTQNEGSTHPIDTSKYRYLTYRMCTDTDTATIVYWHKDASFASNTFGNTGFIQAPKGCRIYSYDLLSDRKDSPNTIAWNAGLIQGLAIKPATAAGITIKLDYVRLTSTPPANATQMTVNWTPADLPVDVYVDDDSAGSNATLLAKGIFGGHYKWAVPSLAPNNYYIIVRAPRTAAAQRSAIVSTTPTFVVNAPPRGSILAPSYVSGPDYATTVVHNPWDMSDPADVQKQLNLASGTFKDGLFTGINPDGNGDPGMILNVTNPIDPSKFYYLTYRMRLDGSQDVGKGSVARALWWTSPDIKSSNSTTKDIVIYEGWRTVSIDLRSALLEPTSHADWNSGLKYGFRLDPDEFPTPRTFDLDDVKLTGNDQASTTFDIKYTANDSENDAVVTSFAYTTDPNGAHAIPLTCAAMNQTAAAASAGGYSVFLPQITNMKGTQTQEAQSSCRWDVRGVPNGIYYIKMTLGDGKNTTTTVSQTPVEVHH